MPDYAVHTRIHFDIHKKNLLSGLAPSTLSSALSKLRRRFEQLRERRRDQGLIFLAVIFLWHRVS